MGKTVNGYAYLYELEMFLSRAYIRTQDLAASLQDIKKAKHELYAKGPYSGISRSFLFKLTDSIRKVEAGVASLQKTIEEMDEHHYSYEKLMDEQDTNSKV